MPTSRVRRAPRVSGMTTALLFDLDDTLVVEEPAAAAAFLATAQVAARRYDVDPAVLARRRVPRARDFWRAGPAYAYGEDTLGMSSWEALWCRWEGDGAEVRACREWAAGYRTRGLAHRARRPRHCRPGAGRAARGAIRYRAPPAPRGVRRRPPGPRRPAPHACTGARSPTARRASSARSWPEAGWPRTTSTSIVISGDLGAGKPEPRDLRAYARVARCDGRPGGHDWRQHGTRHRGRRAAWDPRHLAEPRRRAPASAERSPPDLDPRRAPSVI